MSQRLMPSAALGDAFELPQVVADTAPRQSHLTRGPQVLNTYALELHHLGLLLPVDTPSALIDDALPSCRLPNIPHWLRCMANWNGNVVPIFHLDTLLGFDKPAADLKKTPDKTLIIGQGDEAVGVLVQSVPFRISLKSEDKLNRTPPLPQALQPYARSCYRTDRIWVEWDFRGFFQALKSQF
ncbi:MAG: chemotaxis protein CheW [Gammaproteobacteria bacterium]